MATKKQIAAARRNIKKAQKAWQNMTRKERAAAQPEGRNRTKPGKGGEGDYYHVVLRPKGQFESFRTHDVGRDGHSLRVAGKRPKGSWATQKWLIKKDDAYIENGYLHARNEKVKRILSNLGSTPRRKQGDVFDAKPRRNVPEKEKPTPAQKKARARNIKKAQRARAKQ